MKAIRVSDETYTKLTEILGKLTAEKRKLQTYEDVINKLLAVYDKTQRNHPQIDGGAEKVIERRTESR